MKPRFHKRIIGVLVVTVWVGTVTSIGLCKYGPPADVGDEGAGNCLSFPVVWSDNSAKVLRGEYGVLFLGGESMVMDGDVWYLQQDENNTWQSQSINGTDLLKPDTQTGNYVDVSRIDWGDNLEARSWNINSVVRVETVLYQDLLEPMTGYEMKYLYGQGPGEMHGTNGQEYLSYEATVYSACARLTIQKLTEEPGEAFLEWNSGGGRWSGDVESSDIFNQPLSSTEGPGGYSAEINVKGKVIYGYNWFLRDNNLGLGWYRITFSLDANNNTSAAFNTYFNSTELMVFGEGEIPEEPEEPSEQPSGGIAAIDHANNLTYIDIQIIGRNGGGGANPQRGSGYFKRGNKGRGKGNKHSLFLTDDFKESLLVSDNEISRMACSRASRQGQSHATGSVQLIWQSGGGKGNGEDGEKLAFARFNVHEAHGRDACRGDFCLRVTGPDGGIHRQIDVNMTDCYVDRVDEKAWLVGTVVADTKGCSGSGDGGHSGGCQAGGGCGGHEEEAGSEGQDTSHDGGCTGHDGGEPAGGCGEGGSGSKGVSGKDCRIGQILAVKVHDVTSPGSKGDCIAWKWFRQDDAEMLMTGRLQQWPHLCKKTIIAGNVVVR